LIANNTPFFTFDVQGLRITYSDPIGIEFSSTKSFILDSQNKYFSVNPLNSTSYYFCGTDFNNDGKSTANDFAAWAYYYSPFTPVSGGPAKGDFNCDGYVNANDFSLWGYNFVLY
jgi:hypothetical protein